MTTSTTHMPASAAPSVANDRRPSGKLGLIVALLSHPEGSDIAEMMQATGWQAHSVRGLLAGAVKKRLGYALTSEKLDGVRHYRIPAQAAGAPMPSIEVQPVSKPQPEAEDAPDLAPQAEPKNYKPQRSKTPQVSKFRARRKAAA